jgi:hypothetical protein
MARNTVPRTAPPPVGRNMTVRTTPDMHDDLAVLLTPGGDLSAIVRTALRNMADAYRAAWDYGDVPPGTAPRITGCTYTPAPPVGGSTT